MIRSKNRYMIYTNKAVNVKSKKETPKRNMNIGWIQISEKQDWPEEEIALGLERWPTSTIAELVAI